MARLLGLGALSSALARRCGERSELVAHRGQLAAAWIAFFVTAGVTYHVPPVLLPALMREFGTTQYGVSWLPASFQLAKGLSTLPGGFAVHRLGASRCIRCGTVVLILATVVYPFARSLRSLAVLHGILGVSYNFSGLAPVIVFATSWFEQQRALAIGILVTAFSMAGVSFPPAFAWLIERYGWRFAASACPGLLALVVFPLATALRDGPRAGFSAYEPAAVASSCSGTGGGNGFRRGHVVGRTSLDETVSLGGVYGAAVVHRGGEGRGTAPPPSFVQSLRLGAVWHLAFLSLYQLYVVIALLNTLILYLRTDAGLPLELCGLYSSAVFVASVLGKLLIGAALDSRFQRVAGTGSCLLLVLGTCLPLELGGPQGVRPTTSHARLLLFAVIYGLGYGASYTVISSKPAKLFGAMPEFSKLQGFLMLFQVIGGFTGTLATGKLRAATGSYSVPFCIFVCMGVLGCLHYLLLELGEARSAARADGVAAAAPC